jgi:hypothetical protein
VLRGGPGGGHPVDFQARKTKEDGDGRGVRSLLVNGGGEETPKRRLLNKAQRKTTVTGLAGSAMSCQKRMLRTVRDWVSTNAVEHEETKREEREGK